MQSTTTNQEPGNGWSNGDIPLQLYPSTYEGKLQLYGSHRRYIGLQSGWTRIGGGDTVTELDTRHSTSASTGEVLYRTVEEQGIAVQCLIAQLCEKLYNLGWATGTSGGISIRIPQKNESTNTDNNNNDTQQQNDWRVFVTASGIQKEDMIGQDVFELDMKQQIIAPPKTIGLRVSACTKLWYIIYKHRPTATCTIHTHSLNAVLVTLLDPTETSSTICLSHLEMLKGVGHHAYDDTLVIPIIQNKPSEDLLCDEMEQVIQQYPKCNAVLVRRHGLFVWGDSWEQAKTQCESFDYLFECAIKMKQIGIDPQQQQQQQQQQSTIPPTTLTNTTIQQPDGQKKRKLENSFNGVMATENAMDVQSNVTPLLPRDKDQYKAIVLDIEGCTTSISFVTDVLFPFVRIHLSTYCTELQTKDPTKYVEYVNGFKKEMNEMKHPTIDLNEIDTIETMEPLVFMFMDRDVKSAVLKELQGNMWKAGYDSGELLGHVYPDTVIMLQWMKTHEIPVYIYSSGSIQAQKLLFGHSVAGNLLPYITGHYDITTAGPKKEADSYNTIAQSLQLPIHEICFVSDSEMELYAAKESKLGAPVMCIRPGNAPLTTNGWNDFHSIHSLLQLCG